MPPELVRHFIRGYFDGDGSVTLKTGKSVRVTFVGTKSFLTSLQEILQSNLEISSVKLHRDGNIYIYEKAGNLQTKLIYEWLYRDATVFLERKQKRFVFPLSSL